MQYDMLFQLVFILYFIYLKIYYSLKGHPLIGFFWYYSQRHILFSKIIKCNWILAAEFISRTLRSFILEVVKLCLWISIIWSFPARTSISVGVVSNCCPPDSPDSSLLMADLRCLPGVRNYTLLFPYGSIPTSCYDSLYSHSVWFCGRNGRWSCFWWPCSSYWYLDQTPETKSWRCWSSGGVEKLDSPY